MRIVRFVLPIVLVGFCRRPAAAQTVTGTMQGTVTDASGGVLPGATVSIRNLDTGASRSDRDATKSGFYSAPFLAVGSYSVTATLNGFGTVVRDAVEVGSEPDAGRRLPAEAGHRRRRP